MTFLSIETFGTFSGMAATFSLGAFAALAARRYAEHTADEEWVTLMGVPGRSADPGVAFVERALRQATSGAP